MMVVSLTLMTLWISVNLARLPYEPRVSAAITTPPSYFMAMTELWIFS